MSGAGREGFDLWHPACRWNFRNAFKYGTRWRRLWFWKLVVSDTWNRVCSRPADETKACSHPNARDGYDGHPDGSGRILPYCPDCDKFVDKLGTPSSNKIE